MVVCPRDLAYTNVSLASIIPGCGGITCCWEGITTISLEIRAITMINPITLVPLAHTDFHGIWEESNVARNGNVSESCIIILTNAEGGNSRESAYLA
jgi:hypothetical protein